MEAGERLDLWRDARPPLTFSTLYHSLRGRAKNILRELDHQSIYLLIAGSAAHYYAILRYVL